MTGPKVPGRPEGGLYTKGFLIVDLKKFLVFSAGLIFETVLLDV